MLGSSPSTFENYKDASVLQKYVNVNVKQVLAATQTAGETGKQWFQGTADAVRQFIWVFEVSL